MKLQTCLVFTTTILWYCHVVMSAVKTTEPNTSPTKTKTSGLPETKSDQTTSPPPTTTTPKPVKMEIPKFDFSKLTDEPKTNPKSGIASIPSMDFSKMNEPAPADSCLTDMCKIMNGICKNNGRCIPQVCQSDIVCECDPGYTGQFCDTNITEVIMANDVPMINGKIVSTEAPRVKNGNQGTTGKVANSGKEHVNGHDNSSHLAGSGKSNGPGSVNETGALSTGNNTTKTVDGALGKGSDGVNMNSGVNGNVGQNVKNESGSVSNYTQPKESFLKGPEVPTPTTSRPIDVNVKKQKIREKSTTMIQRFTDIVTISTVSIKLEKQPLSHDITGQTVSVDKGSNKNTQGQSKRASKETQATGAKEATGKPKKDQSTNKKDTPSSDIKGAKNIERVILTNGKLHLVEQRVEPVDSTTRGQKTLV